MGWFDVLFVFVCFLLNLSNKTKLWPHISALSDLPSAWIWHTLECQFVSSWDSQEDRGTKTIVASWHCHPESFCASGKFLRVTLEIALGSFQTVWKISGLSRWSGKVPDSLENFQRVWKISGWSRKFPESFRLVRIFSRWFRKFPIAWKVSG